MAFSLRSSINEKDKKIKQFRKWIQTYYKYLGSFSLNSIDLDSLFIIFKEIIIFNQNSQTVTRNSYFLIFFYSLIIYKERDRIFMTVSIIKTCEVSIALRLKSILDFWLLTLIAKNFQNSLLITWFIFS